MINSISSNLLSNNSFFNFQNALTEEQKKSVNEIITKYDPKNMTEELYNQMHNEIKKLGIGPNKELGDILINAGFNLPEPPRMLNIPPKGSLPNFINQNSADIFTSFMQKHENGTATKEDFENMLQKLYDNGEDLLGLFVNAKM